MYPRIGWTLAALASASIGVAVAQTTPASPPGQSPAMKPPVAEAVAPPMASKPPMTAIPSPAATSAPMPVPPPVTTTTTSTAPSAVATSTTPVPAGAPVAGANSFTESQARSRIEDQGFTEVINLAKDDQSIWRGTAMKGGVSSRVAVDYQGNVVIN